MLLVVMFSILPCQTIGVAGSFDQSSYMKPQTFIDIACCLLSLLFIYTGVSKLLTLHQFASTLSRFDIIHAIAPLISYLVIGIELVVGIMLLLKSTRLVALCLSFALLVSFTLFITFLLLFAKQQMCNCGGVIGKMSWPQHLVFNLFFIALAAIAIKSFMHETGQAENLQKRVGTKKNQNQKL